MAHRILFRAKASKPMIPTRLQHLHFHHRLLPFFPVKRLPFCLAYDLPIHLRLRQLLLNSQSLNYLLLGPPLAARLRPKLPR